MINHITELLNSASDEELRQIVTNIQSVLSDRESARQDELKNQILNLAKTWNNEFPFSAIWADIVCEDCQEEFTEDLMDLIIKTLS